MMAGCPSANQPDRSDGRSGDLLGGYHDGHPGMVHEANVSHTSRHAGKSGARHPYRPGTGAAARSFEERTGVKAPRIIAWEITRSCNLACAHCRASAHCEPYSGELSLTECKRVIDDIASITDPILILTGGEPLMRKDIWDIIDYAHENGLHPVIGTNGTLVDDECAQKIAEHGIPRVSVSLDFPDAAGQDGFRGKRGAFSETIQGMRNLRKYGVEVQVNTTITKMNNHLMCEMHELALEEDAAAFHPFLLVPTGRGQDLVDVELTPDEYEEALTWAYQCQKTSPMHFKPTDAPQYYRIIRQLSAQEGREVNRETFGMEAMTRGCLGGITFAFISHIGDVQPCGYFDMHLGNVKEEPFSRIWETSPVFDDLRHYDRLKGKCGVCEYKGVCGGCRARALAATGDYLAEEPYCAYMPLKMVEERVLDEIQSGFPLDHDPYGALANRLDLPRDQVVSAVAHLRDDGSIRQICASISSRKLGGTSTLCGLKIEGPQERIDAVAELISAHPEVTHNYQRDDEYNIWFTPIAESPERLHALIEEIKEEAHCDDFLNLPVTRMHKIRVDFGKKGRLRLEKSAALHKPFDSSDPFDVAFIRWAQSDMVGEHPFEDGARLIGREIGDEGITEKRVINRLIELQSEGVIRRFGAFVRHRKLGYTFNGMTVWNAEDAEAFEIGQSFAALPYVSHCYERARAEGWPYNVYAMVHAKTQDELDAYVLEMKELSGLDARVILSVKEYKKSLPLFFGGPLGI